MCSMELAGWLVSISKVHSRCEYLSGKFGATVYPKNKSEHKYCKINKTDIACGYNMRTISHRHIRAIT